MAALKKKTRASGARLSGMGVLPLEAHFGNMPLSQ